MRNLQTLEIQDLENVYDALAEAIDKAGKENTELFLVKLALLNANALGQISVFNSNIDAALKDL